METSQPSAIESSSYRWLINKKPSFDGLINEPFRISLDNSDEGTSEERKSKMVISQRDLIEAQNFNFDLPISKSPPSIVHADEIFSGGQIIPIYVDQPSKIESFNDSNSIPATPISAILSSENVCPAIKRTTDHFYFLRKWQKSSERVLQKSFGFLRPLFHKVGCSRKSVKVDDIDWKVWENKSWNDSPLASPQENTPSCTSDFKRKGKSCSNSPLAYPHRSPSYSKGDWCHIESSIYEAILHCKRSIEK